MRNVFAAILVPLIPVVSKNLKPQKSSSVTTAAPENIEKVEIETLSCDASSFQKNEPSWRNEEKTGRQMIWKHKYMWYRILLINGRNVMELYIECDGIATVSRVILSVQIKTACNTLKLRVRRKPNVVLFGESNHSRRFSTGR